VANGSSDAARPIAEPDVSMRPVLCCDGRHAKLQEQIAHVTMLLLRDLLAECLAPVAILPPGAQPIVMAGAADHVLGVVAAAAPFRMP
jgi:hypothetical protein